MKIALEYAVDSNVEIGSEIRIARRDKEYVFLPDAMGNLRAVRIVSNVLNLGEITSNLAPGSGNTKASITIDVGGGLWERLVAEFQELESVLAFSTNGAFRKVIWSQSKLEFIPETESDVAAIDVSSLEVQESYPPKRARLDSEALGRIIDTKSDYSSLIVPKSFYREGLIEYEELRYINAFHSFYYVLEDLYSGGKTRSRDVIREMQGCQELRDIMSWAIDHIIAEPKHDRALRLLFDSEKLHFDVDGFIELLVRMRGRSHHYISKGGDRFPTPFRQRDYHSIAWITLGIASLAIMYKIVDINQGRS